MDEVHQKGVLKVLKVMIEVKEILLTPLAHEAHLQYPYVKDYVALLVGVGLLRTQDYGRNTLVTLEQADPRLPPLQQLFAEWKVYPVYDQAAYLRILRIVLSSACHSPLYFTEIQEQAGMKGSTARKCIKALIASGSLQYLTPLRRYTVECTHWLVPIIERYFAAWNGHGSRGVS